MVKELNQQNNYGEVLNKLQRYCSYQERAISEVKRKAQGLLENKDQVEEVIEALMESDFLNQERFVSGFIRGKVSQKKWGKHKIIAALREKNVDQNLINECFDELDEQLYTANLESLIESRVKGQKISRDEKAKLYRFLVAKGYENELVLKELNKLH